MPSLHRLPAAGLLLVAALVASFAMPAAAQWKWKDKAGQIQYSDLPPPSGTPDNDILQRPQAATPAAAPRAVATPASGAASAPLLTAKTSDPDLEAKRKKAEQDEAAKKRAQDEKLAMEKLDNCTRARVQLKALDEGQRMSRINPTTGEREYLDDKGRAEETQRTRAVIASDCSK